MGSSHCQRSLVRTRNLYALRLTHDGAPIYSYLSLWDGDNRESGLFSYSRTRLYGRLDDILWAGWVAERVLPSTTRADRASLLCSMSPFIVIPSFSRMYLKPSLPFRHTGYMTTSGLCPIFEGSRHNHPFLFLALKATFFISINSKIGSKHGPFEFDIAMLPIGAAAPSLSWSSWAFA